MIVILQAAPTAMKQPALAEYALQQVEKSSVSPVDFVGLLQSYYAIRTADGAAA